MRIGMSLTTGYNIDRDVAEVVKTWTSRSN